MSMTIEQKRREIFEHALRRDWAAHLVVMDRDGDGYVFGDIDSAWWAFNAALDAVVIEFPERDAKGSGSPDSEIGASLEQYEAVAYNFALDDCRSAIQSTGLGLKVLP
jgi:hypothetical protein